MNDDTDSVNIPLLIGALLLTLGILFFVFLVVWVCGGGRAWLLQ